MTNILEKFGVISICVLGIHLTRIISDYVYKKSVAEYYKKGKLKDLGQWAVVLGADKSIGQAFAVELAKQGLNIVLIGSNMPKLSNLSNLLEKYFKVLSGVISLTFTTNEFSYIEKALRNLDIAVLINVPDYTEATAKPEYFLKMPNLDSVLSTAINRNLAAVTKMCAIVMPGMVFKRKGIIINVSSITSKTCCPLLALYGASAAYVKKFSEELRNEYSSSGVIIQTLIPGYVRSNRWAENKSWLTPSPRDYVGSAMKRFGFRGETTGYTPHSLILCVLLSIQALCPKITASLVRKMNEFARNETFAQFSAVGVLHTYSSS